MFDAFSPLMNIVRCPYTKTPLVLMPLSEFQGSLSATEKDRIPDGTIAVMVSTAAGCAYPIIGQIISFLEQDTLKISADALQKSIPASLEPKLIQLDVKKWYDEFGWEKNETGQYLLAFSSRTTSKA